MSNKQRPPEEKAGHLIDINKTEFARYTKHMIQHDFPAFTIIGSYVEKYKTVMNTGCILVICKTNTKTMLGYAKMIYSKHPLVRRLEDVQKKIDLENIISVYILDEKKLHLKYSLPLTGQVKELTFEFLSKTLLQHWVSFIHQQNAILRGNAVKEANPDRQRLASLEQQHKTLLALYDDLKRICLQGDAKIQSSLAKQQQMQAEIDRMRGYEEKAKQLEEERGQLLKNVEEACTSKQKKEEECTQLIKQIQTHRETIEGHESEIKSLKQQLQSSQAEVESLRRQLEEREKLERTLQQQNRSAVQKLKLSYEPQIASLREEFKYKLEQLDKQTNYAKQQEQTVTRLKVTIQEQKATIERLSTRCQQQSTAINQSTQREEELNRQLQHYSAKLQQKQQEEILLRLQALFVGEALQDYHHHKLFLKETLQAHRQLTIRRTKLLFRFDPLNKVNFHQYIDHHPDLLLIIKTAEGAFLAGYTQSPITPSNAADRPGVIMSLTNQLSFQLQEDRRCVSYDEYYIIFGNSEIRLKSLELTVFSNFGISNGFFLNRGLGVEALLCNANREVPIETFELHQVYFSQ